MNRFAAVARHQGLSDSALLKCLVDLMLQSASAADVGTPGGADRTCRDSRLTVRIRPDDQLLLRERAAARGMAAASYLSVLTRSHLRSLAPLPKAERLTLEKIVTELSKLGRNINQITRAANRGERVSDPGSNQFRAMFTICNALRVNTK
jgi:Bacterial mobilisation protein (MobC)